MPTATARPARHRSTAGGSSARDGAARVRYRLLRDEPRAALVRPSAAQRAVIDHVGGRLRVLAGPGTGKTATIVEAVADRILRRGVDPSAVLVLTFSRRAAAELAQRIAARLPVTVTEPLVRTLHSYAYALLRSAAVAAGEPPPRLLDAGQADLMVREILAGHLEDGAARWPPHLRAALAVPAFAAELREFMLRTAEREVPPRRIAELGRRLRRPEWQAAAAFIAEYRDIGDLRQASSRLGAALDQAELTIAALDRLSEPEVLAGQQARIRHIFVDEYQDVDPAQSRLVELLSSGADELVVVGDPDQSIFAFRGAASGALERVPVDATVALTECYRMPPELVEATRRVASRLPGATGHRVLRAVPHQGTSGTVHVRILTSPAQEAAFVADRLRRAHLEEGIAWSQMAVVLRSPAGSADTLRRAFTVAGVPVTNGAGQAPAADPLVAALLDVLRAGSMPHTLTAPTALALLASPLGGMDPQALRRLRRAVRNAGDDPAGSSGDRLASILSGQQQVPDGLAADLARPLRHVAQLIALARAGADEPAAESVLWRVWEFAGLAPRLLAGSERGGRDGAVADGMLDAVVALFDRAAELADQLPGAGIRGLLELVEDEHVPGPARPARDADAVTVLSAHSAKGLEWDLVAVAGVQQDRWPDLRPRASLLGLDALLDAASGIDPSLPGRGALTDERRLFYVAVTRARRHLLVTAVQDEENAPSRFLAELAGPDAVPTGWPADHRGRPRRALYLPALLADLRRAVAGGGALLDGTASGGTATADGAPARADLAAQVLARLAAAGVPGAHPRDWHGLAAPSTSAPVATPGTEVVLSPSQVESLLDCPLRAVLERGGARGAPGQPQLLGVAVHALAQGIAEGVSASELDAAVDGFLAAQDHLPPWEVARLRRMMQTMRGALQAWMREVGTDRTFVGAELPIDVRLPTDGTAEHPVRLVGRVDHLSADQQGRLIVTDFKSGASVPTRAAASEHAQLAVYQLAAALGAFAQPVAPEAPVLAEPAPLADAGDGTAPAPPELGGGELVYLRSGRPKTLPQPPQDAEQRARWMGRLQDAAQSAAGPTLIARQGEGCERCPVRSCCPLQPEGRQVTG